MKAKRFATLMMGLMLCAVSFAQGPVYVTKALKPIEPKGYEAEASVQVRGHQTWKNAFTLWQAGEVTFNLDGKYENISFVMAPVHRQIYKVPTIVLIHADGRTIFDSPVKTDDLPRHITLNVSGVKSLKFSLVDDGMDLAFCEVALWTKGQTVHDLQDKYKLDGKKKMLFRDLKPYYLSTSADLQDGSHKWVAPGRNEETIKIGNKTWDHGLILKMDMQLIGNGAAETHLNINGQYETLQFTVGPMVTDDASNGKGWVTVLGDNKILYEYEIEQHHIARQVTLDVTGVKKLTFASEQSHGSHWAGIVDAWIYPKGEKPAETVLEGEGKPDPRLKQLPDVCKLISNIPPYSLRGNVSKQLYDGTSDYVTFSMGGTKFNEGFLLYNFAGFMSDDAKSHAIFDLGNEFDYVSFVTGYVSKSWYMGNDELYVYADDQLIKTIPLCATYPNQKHVLPLNKCRKLKFESKGQGTMDVAAYGVADLVVYRGEPVENELFAHPVPECPDEIDLIDLGAPYLHYISSSKSGGFVDGKSKKDYFTRYDNSRIYKGFVLQTSTHFSLDFGVLSGTDAAGASTIGAAAVGASFVPIGSVGGAVVGTSLMSVAALMMLAAGGEAVENSCAAFNTYGQYNSVTFTVECLRTEGDTQFFGPDTYQPDISERKEKLLIGADHIVMAELAVFEGMKPQTVTVPINGCEQLMFWLANTNGTSAAYVFHDIKLSKKKCELEIPEDMRPAEAVVTELKWTELTLPEKWEKPENCGVAAVDNYFYGIKNLHYKASKALKGDAPDFDVYTYYLETEAKQICKAVKLISKQGGDMRIPYTVSQYDYNVKSVVEMKKLVNELAIMQISAGAGLAELGLGAIAYGKIFKETNKFFKQLKAAVDEMYKCTLENEAYLKSLISTPIDIDGRQTTERTLFSPLSPGEKVPEGPKSKVRNFAE